MRATVHQTVAVASLALAVAGCARRLSKSSSGTLEGGAFPTSWYAGGATCAGRPEFRVHAYNDDFFILRQPACTNYEKPFLYLVFGRDRVLLLDTGAGKIDVASDVSRVIDQWLARHGRSSIDLVVAHSHAHGDHVAGDSLFAGRARTVVVGRDTAAVREFFGIAHWPEDVAQFDLGGRVLDIVPIPGHQPASIALYDRRTGILLSGDTFYPGRLYVRDTAAFANSVRRLVEFTRDRPVTHILGTHIENSSTPFVDYAVGTVDQPSEHVLELSRAQLLQLDSAVATMRGRFTRAVMKDFTIWPQVGR